MQLILGKVIFTDFYGANGYTIIIKQNDFEYLYAHVDPCFLVQKNQSISKGQKIGIVGEMYVLSKYGKEKVLNGSLTGPHLHLTIKKSGKPVNPLDYL